MNKRDELVKELGNLVKKHSNSGISHKLSYTMKLWELELVAEYILAREEKIVLPCTQINILAKSYGGYHRLHYSFRMCSNWNPQKFRSVMT